MIPRDEESRRGLAQRDIKRSRLTESTSLRIRMEVKVDHKEVL